MDASINRQADQMSFSFEGSPAIGTMDRTKKKTKTSVKTGNRTRQKAEKAEEPKSQTPQPEEISETKPAESPLAAAGKPKRTRGTAPATAESLAAKQREISVSEFFAKNRHLLGFDNPRKALLTATKEAVDNSLDACEDAQILPELLIDIKAISENRFVLRVQDNGPGIVKQQIPNVFARLLYGSKFHTLKMSRGQQGIGISAAGMYGLLTTGEPVQIVSRTHPSKKAHQYHVQIDTSRNKPEIVLEQECDYDLPTGTSVTIALEGKYQKGRQSVDEYIAQTAMANPHAHIVYRAPDGSTYEYPRQVQEPPVIPREIKPHPYGVELGVLFKMARQSPAKRLSTFLHEDFSRVSERVAQEICSKAKLKSTLRPSNLTLKEAESLHLAIQETRIMSPATDCISPIGAQQLEEGLKRVVEADFYTSCSRSPAVYRGNPFLIEAALAYGVKNGEQTEGEPEKEPLMRVIRIANRVPLLYQQSACAIYKAVMDINWRNYALSQSKGALPSGPVVLMVHIASVWVPFTSESKEAIAHYPEIIREIQLAVQDCGRKLGLHVRKKKRIQQEMDRRRYIETYLPVIGEALQHILSLKQNAVDDVVVKLKTVLERSRKV